MKLLKLLAMTLLIALIVNCAKKEEVKTYEQYEENGVKITKNNGTPADSTLELNLRKVFTISSQVDSVTMLKYVTNIIEDKDQNIYILDGSASNIKKFNKLGEFQKIIGRAGQGPGEFHYPAIVFINNDTLTVYNNGSRKVSKFDLDGKFYYEKKVNSLYFQNGKMSPDGKNLSYDYLKMLVVDTKDIIKYGLSVLDVDSVKEKSEILNRQYTMADFAAGKFNPIENTVTFCVGSDHTYLSDDSDYQYRFTGYDKDGNKKMDVKKAYKKIRFTDIEKDDYRAAKSKGTTKNIDDVKAAEFKKAIHSIHVDKYNRVLVIPVIDRRIDEDGVYLDIFKDGVFLNRVDYKLHDKDIIGIPLKSSGEEYFSGKRMYFVNVEDMSIDVYDY
ncbi:MAG: 6-bladed beta-propeller [Candidatus Delongbacteria bacterium]|jgi:hypothetical protein|nr:6-bladed beta-propeller [Candidatus Delongbacteria bacterium]